MEKEQELEYISEGQAKIYTTNIKTNSKGAQFIEEAFYNPVQKFNRDLTIYIIKSYQQEILNNKEISILDALSASGLRTIRFSKEIENLKQVHGNDLSTQSVILMKKNFALNSIEEDEKHKISQMDANLLMQQSEQQYDVIDLDPYGSVIPFIDSALKAVKDNGLICATCTDLKVLEGPDIFKCYTQYNASRAYKIGSMAENSIRIVLSTISQSANRMGKFILPIFSFRSDFYIRLFFQVKSGKTEAYQNMLNNGFAFFCEYCQNFKLHSIAVKCDKLKQNKHIKLRKLNLDNHSRCDQCDSPYTLNGPIWLDPINNLSFISHFKQHIQQKYDPSQKIDTTKRILAFIDNMLQEKDLENQVYSFSISRMTKFLRLSCPRSIQIQSALQSLNFKAKRCYLYCDLIKTDAPFQAIFDVFKQMKINIMKQENYLKNLNETDPAYKVLNKPIQYVPDFNFKAIETKIPIFFPNPEKNWGPKKKAATRKIINQEQIDNQNKKIKQEKD